jgi:hypothetical protein
MPSEKYHQKKQKERISKRLCLHDCFNKLFPDSYKIDDKVFITFGGEDLEDCLDFLLCAMNRNDGKIWILSYEENEDVYERAKKSSLVRCFEGHEFVKIELINNSFPYELDRLKELRVKKCQFIYHIDLCGLFEKKNSEIISTLLDEDLLIHNDSLLITSSRNPRVLHRKDFIVPSAFKTGIETRFNEFNVSNSFLADNYVEYLVVKTVNDYSSSIEEIEPKKKLGAFLKVKYKYRDTSNMSLYYFSLINKPNEGYLKTSDFKELPKSFVASDDEDFNPF